MEFWKPISGFTGIYEVSDLGRVRRVARRVGERVYPERVRKNTVSGSGYPMLRLAHGDVSRTAYVHTLVLEAFVGERPRKHVACHINGDRDDPSLDNLYWGTHSRNAYDAVDHGTHVSNQTRKLTHQQAGLAQRMRQRGERIVDIGNTIGVSRHVVTDVLRGRTFAGEYKV